MKEHLSAPRWALVSALLGGCIQGSNGPPGQSANEGPCGSDIEVLFSPMYSAYDGVHTFQIPAIVNGINPSIVRWSASGASEKRWTTRPPNGHGGSSGVEITPSPSSDQG